MEKTRACVSKKLPYNIYSKQQVPDNTKHYYYIIMLVFWKTFAYDT